MVAERHGMRRRRRNSASCTSMIFCRRRSALCRSLRTEYLSLAFPPARPAAVPAAGGLPYRRSGTTLVLVLLNGALASRTDLTNRFRSEILHEMALKLVLPFKKATTRV